MVVGVTYRSARCGAEVHIAHEPGSVELIQSLVRRIRPSVIVELGTYMGGLTLALHDAWPKAELHSFDVKNVPGEIVSSFPGSARREWFGPHVHFYADSVLGTPHNFVREVLARPGRALLYCDNGDKAAEVNTYGPMLKRGDVLGVHDWLSEVWYAQIERVLKDFLPWKQREFIERSFLSRFWMRVA